MQTTASKSNSTANLNLLQSIIVDPEPNTIVDQLQDLPAVVGAFLQERVLPILGEYQSSEASEL